MSYGGSSGGSGKIATSADVALNSLQPNDVLTYDAITQKWKNAVSAGLNGVTVTGTSVAGQVLTATSASSATWSTPSSGGGGGGSSSASSTIIDVTSAGFGAKGDGIILNDLTVSSGSTSISSAAGPFTSTAVDAGKLVYWLSGGNSVTSGVIASVQSSTQATLTVAASAGSAIFGGPNTNGVIGTDNTAAFNAALTASQAAKAAASSVRREQVPAAKIHIPSGIFLTKSLTAIQQMGVTVDGEGKYVTWIACCERDAVFSLSTFSTSVDTYSGTATHFSVSDLHFINPCYRSGGTEGGRVGIAVQDNGSGNVNIANCVFTGLQYGFAGAYGTDFDFVRECYFELCDVGIYFGGGSQQIEVNKTDFYFCREGIVFEGVSQWHVGNGCSWENSSVADINIEAKPSGTTRFGLSVSANGFYYAGMWTIENCWFETHAGGYGAIAPRSIWLNGQGPNGNYQERVTVRDCTLVSGGQQQSGGTDSFIEIQSAYAPPYPIIVSNVRISGNHINYVIRNSGSGGTITPKVEDTVIPSGSNITMFSSGVGTSKYIPAP